MRRHGTAIAILALLLLAPWSVAAGGAVAPASPRPAALFLDYGYTGASGNDSLAIFDLTTWTLSGTLSLLPEGDYPYDATITPDGREVWIAGAAGDGVIVVDTAINQVTHHIPAGSYTIGVAFRADGAYAFVSGRDSEDISVIDTSTYAVVDTIAVPTYYLGAGNLAINPCGDELYLVDWYDDSLIVVDTVSFTVTQVVRNVGSSLWQLVVHPQGDFLYITDRGQDNVHVLDTATLSQVTTIPVGDDPWGIDITPDGALIYVASEDGHNVTAIDAANNSVITTIALPHGSGSDPRDVDFDAAGDYAYVPSGDVTGNDAVYVLDTAAHTVAGQIDVAPANNPNVVAVAPQMAGCAPLRAFKEAAPEPVVLGDALTYTVSYLYTAPTPTLALVTDTLPAGTAYLTSSGGLGSSYDPGSHRVVWNLGTVPGGTAGGVTAVVVPTDPGLAGQAVVNRADLGFAALAATAWATSTVVTPELAIRLPDGSAPPDPLDVCAGQDVTLIAASNRAGPLAYAWDLGDGSTASSREVSHSWALGAYTVAVTTTNLYGWSEHDTLAVHANPAPTAAFLSNSPVELGRPAHFTDTSAFTPTAWSWDFGDGTGQSGAQNPSYLYTSAGVYTVTLEASNACGSNTAAGLFVVLEPPCVPVQTAAIGGPVVLAVGEVGLYAASYAPPTATQPVTVTWDNGTVGSSAAYSWTAPGVYAVTAAVANPCGQAPAALTVTVTPLPCTPVQTAAISGPVVLGVGEVGLYAASYAPPTATQPVTVTWDNGTVGSGAAYSWTAPGVYAVTAAVANPCGQAPAALTVTVTPLPCTPVQTAAISGPVVLGVGEVGLYGASYAPPTATQPVTIAWDNGAVGSSAAYSWTVPGLYAAAITVTNPCGSAWGAIEVAVQPSPASHHIYLPLIVRN